MSVRRASWEEAAELPGVSAFVSTYVRTYDTLSNPDATPAYVTRLRAAMAAMSRLASQPCATEEAAAIFNHPEIKPRSVAMRRLYAEGEAALERLESRQPDVAATLARTTTDYAALVAAELKLVPQLMLREGRSIAMIAPGACPASAVHIFNQTGYPVIGIEPNARNVPLARAFIRAAGLSRQIRIVHGQPEHYDYSLHPIILMSTCTPNKAELLGTIDGQSIGTILMRVGHGLSSLLYPAMSRSAATWMEEGNFSITPRLDNVASRTLAMSTWFFTKMQARKRRDARRVHMGSLELGLLGRRIRQTGPQAIPGLG